MVSKLGFIIGSTIFFLFIVQVSAYVGTELVSGFEPSTTTNFTGISVLDLIIGVVNNVGIFIALIGVSSEFSLFNGTILLAYATGMIWAIVELLRGV